MIKLTRDWHVHGDDLRSVSISDDETIITVVLRSYDHDQTIFINRDMIRTGLTLRQLYNNIIDDMKMWQYRAR